MKRNQIAPKRRSPRSSPRSRRVTRRSTARRPARSTGPTLAVVVCTRDRPESLFLTWDSVRSQTRRPDELIVMNDGELPEPVQNAIAKACKAERIPLTIRRTTGAGLTRARNEAASLSTSDVLVYMDDDVSCDPEFLAGVAQCMEDPLVGGLTAVIEEPRWASGGPRLYQWGYALAGWWRVRPQCKPAGPKPAILSRADIARPAQWLCGAAMALRREIVLRHRFDETLDGYALGEDREMSYRLAAHHWLVESRRAKVVHRRDPGPRADPRRFGYLTSRNYLYILRKTCRIGVGEAILIGWSLLVLMAMHLVWAIGPSRRKHLAELWGMLEGVIPGLCAKLPDAAQKGQARAVICTPPPEFAYSVRDATSERRVLFVTNRLEPGGAERMLVSLARQLPSFGIRPFVACLKDAGPLAPHCREKDIPVYEGSLHSKFDAGVIPRLRRIISENAIDVVVAAHSGGDRMFWSTLAGRPMRAPVVVWSHWFPRPHQHHFERANRALYRCVDAFISLGEAHRRALIRNEYVPAGRIAVIHNAIDVERFASGAATPPARRRARKSLGLATRHVAIAIIANLRREKRHDVFIEAAKRLTPSHPNLRFLIIGDGPNREAVQAAAAASGLDGDVLRLLGLRDDIEEILPGIDICCLCSEQECFSVTMLEAAAAGCAFIGPMTGCMTDFLEDRVTGLAIRPADAAGLTDAIAELAADSELRRGLAQEASRRVERFGIEAMARAFANLLRSLPQRPIGTGLVGRSRG